MSNEDQKHLDHHGVADLGLYLLDSELLPTAGELGFAYRILGVQIDIEAPQRLPADLAFSPKLQQRVVNP